MIRLSEPLPELFTRSKVLILDFAQIKPGTPNEANIKAFFDQSVASGQNPRLPANRQRFNNRLIALSNCRYLVGRYGEDRIAMLADTPAGKEGRTIHMAIDVFSKSLEPVYAPADGEIIISDYEAGFGEYGNYIIFKPADEDYYVFFGHLANDRIGTATVKRGQLLAHLGDYPDNENGGWSRHLHIQILKDLPGVGMTPDGYSSRQNYTKNSLDYPNPLSYFSDWQAR